MDGFFLDLEAFFNSATKQEDRKINTRIIIINFQNILKCNTHSVIHTKKPWIFWFSTNWPIYVLHQLQKSYSISISMLWNYCLIYNSRDKVNVSYARSTKFHHLGQIAHKIWLCLWIILLPMISVEVWQALVIRVEPLNKWKEQ